MLGFPAMELITRGYLCHFSETWKNLDLLIISRNITYKVDSPEIWWNGVHVEKNINRKQYHAHPAVLVFRVGGRDSRGQLNCGWASELTTKRMVLKTQTKYPLVNQRKFGKSPLLMGKSPISMAIFNSKLLVITRG